MQAINQLIKYTIILIALAYDFPAWSQRSALDILNKCIKVHDPKNTWMKLKASFDMSIIRDKAADRYFTVRLDLPKKSFQYKVQNDTLRYVQGYANNKFFAELNGIKNISEAETKRYDLTESRTQYLRGVYEYLLLLPMRLHTDKAYLDTTVRDTLFNGKRCYKISMKYEPVDQKETWHFFIDKTTYILHGYQFYLKDPSTTGEFIYLDEFTNFDGLLIPRIKKWHWNKDGSFFRTDTILKIKT